MSTDSEPKERRSRFAKKKVSSRPRVNNLMDGRKTAKFSTRKLKGLFTGISGSFGPVYTSNTPLASNLGKNENFTFSNDEV